MYDDTSRLLRTVTASEWTVEDRSLMLAHQQYKATLCPGCGHPKATAWHPDNHGYFKAAGTYTCDPCTARAGKDSDGNRQPVIYRAVVDTRDYDDEPLPPMPLPAVDDD